MDRVRGGKDGGNSYLPIKESVAKGVPARERYGDVAKLIYPARERYPIYPAHKKN